MNLLKKLTIPAFLTLFIFLLFFKANESTAEKVPPPKYSYELVFESPIFDEYYAHIDKKTGSLDLPEEIKILLATHAENPDEKRLLHENLVTLLRERLKSTKQEALDSLSFDLIAGGDIFPEHADFLSRYLDLSDEIIESTPLPELLEYCFEKLSSQFPSQESYRKKDPKRVDVQLDGFLPTSLFSIDSSQYLYMFNPIIQDKTTQEKSINPIFIAYLRHLKKNNQTHLYVNVKNRIPLLEELATSKDFKGTFFIATFNRDNDFFHQQNEWEEKNEMKPFKEELAKFFQEKEVKVQWPEKFDQTKLPQIFDQIHEAHFSNASTLNAVERAVFVEIAEAKLVETLRNTYKPSYMNDTCAYTMDRGPGQYVTDYAYDLYRKNGKLSTDEKRTLLTLYFISPIISHNRPPHDYYVKRLSNLLRILFPESIITH